MLLSTFQHLKGIGNKRELDLWNSGVVFWEDLESKKNAQLSMFLSKDSDLENGIFLSSRKALEEGNVAFFSQRLPRQEHYRIALSFPSKTLFLDIETTGLSLYYDTITIVGWSIEKSYSVYITGDDDSTLGTSLSEAKAIVTFNGTLFDLPFIRKEFKKIPLPPVHIDLRFLAKRVGLSGGQKSIESTLGIKRQKQVTSLGGEAAPLLWHQYRRGDLDALKLLISYNHADVDGMKLIFDAVVDRLIQKQQFPLTKQAIHRFSSNLSELRWASGKTRAVNDSIRLHPYWGQGGPTFSFQKLAHAQDLSQLRIVGIDLTGSESRPSGWCLLEMSHAFTQHLFSDADLIKATIDAKPDLVSVDSPLSLPKGRISVSDDDPGRKDYGIIRYCERLLKKRGINVYPCLIRSMQGVTARGIRLAKYFRGQGIPVIESYPGAAQDIMNIPRKRASLEFLKEGLAEFGITGEYLENKVSHDELDAITSAVVGIFFWSGKFEALGNDEEEYLIVPEVHLSSHAWSERKIIGLSGPIAAGKTTAGAFLKSQGFHYGRFSLVLEDMLRDRGKEPSRKSLQQIGEEINKHPGQRWLCKELVRRFPTHGNLVIDGLRFPEDHAFLAEKFGPAFLHIHIEASKSVRLQRYLASEGSKEGFDLADSHVVEANVTTLAQLAHVTVSNINDMESFLTKIGHVIEKKAGRDPLVCP